MNFLGNIGQQLMTPYNKDGEPEGERAAGFEVSEFVDDVAAVQAAANTEADVNIGIIGSNNSDEATIEAMEQHQQQQQMAEDKKDSNIDRSSFNVISKAATDRLGEVQRMIEGHNWKENTAIVIPPCFHLVDAAFRVIRGVVTKKQLFMIRQKLSAEEMKNVTPKYTNVYGIYFMIIATSRKLAKHVLAMEKAKLSNAGVAGALLSDSEHQMESQMHVVSGEGMEADMAAAAAGAVSKPAASALNILSSTAVTANSPAAVSAVTAEPASVITHDLISSDNGAVLGAAASSSSSGEAPVMINAAPVSDAAAAAADAVSVAAADSVTTIADASPPAKKAKIEARPLDLTRGEGTCLIDIPESKFEVWCLLCLLVSVVFSILILCLFAFSYSCSCCSMMLLLLML